MNDEGYIKPKSILVVFAYAPAGLGHLRVADALYHGLGKDIPHSLLGSDDQMINTIHWIMSNHPIGHKIMEWSQKGIAEDIFTTIYRWVLRRNTKSLTHKLKTILKQRIDRPKTILVVATHFGLAHKLAAIKDKFWTETGKRIFLTVQVTDDSPQHLWYIAGADLLVVPSQYTKGKLISYGKKSGLKHVPIVVLPYPISPTLRKPLTKTEYKIRLSQADSKKDTPIHTIVPISGATVGLPYLTDIINNLSEKSSRFVFHVVSKSTSYSKPFLRYLQEKQNLLATSSASDREVVELYEKAYQENIISFEITKPSEQSFKALISPRQTGGSILLFTSPVGRQEYDNLNFLIHHNLIPSDEEMNSLFKLSRDSSKNNDNRLLENLLERARNWRGIRLPEEPSFASSVTHFCLTNGIFHNMVGYSLSKEEKKKFPHEIGDDGVERFWKKVFHLVLG